MASPQPFLSAGLPGLTFGLSLGRGLSIQYDPNDQSGNEEEELNPEEDVLFFKNATVPSATLVVHVYAIHGFTVSAYDTNEELYVYISIGIGATNKLTSLKVVQSKHTPLLVFNEIKHIPFLVNSLPKERMNKLVLSVSVCKAGEEHTVTKSKHKLVGRYEAHLHKILKNVTMHIDAELLDKKANIVGKIEMECCAVYGSFGYGQSYQLKNSLHSSSDLVKMSLLPRIPPVQDQRYRGTLLKPQKLLHPKFVPLENEAVETLEPSISDSYDKESLECPTFPLLQQHMQRITHLRSVLQKQNTRTKRVSFLRKVLQDGGAMAGNSEFDEGSDDESQDKQAPVPQALALLMNASKFFADAPGIIRRKTRGKPSNSLNTPAAETSTSRPYNLAPDVQNRNVEEMKDRLFTNRRKSIAPTNN